MEAIEIYKEETVKMAEKGSGQRKVGIEYSRILVVKTSTAINRPPEKLQQTFRELILYVRDKSLSS